MMSKTIEQIEAELKTISVQMEEPELTRSAFDSLSKEQSDLRFELEYCRAKQRGVERKRIEEERQKQKAADEEVERVKALYVAELQKNNDGWQKLITSIRRQIQKSKELQSQMTEALPSVKAEFTHFFREEEIYHWFFLCLWSHEETGRFLKTANQIFFPAIHREIQMNEHVPPLGTEEVKDED